MLRFEEQSSRMRSWLFLLAVCGVAVYSEHAPEHTDSPLDVSYETVTQIIKALRSKPEVAEQTTDAGEEEGDELTEGKPQETIEEVPDNAFQKRKQVYVARVYRKPLRDFVDSEPVNAEHVVQKIHEEEPCDSKDEEEVEHIEIVEEDDYPGYVGSLRGTPGVDYPNYSEIPLTSFTCADKKRIPGFYADVETHCQVFHVCYPHRRESFLCPIGTTFNQPILACDYWYSSNCSAAPEYFDMEEELEPEAVEEIVEDLISTVEVEPTEPVIEDYTETPEELTFVVSEQPEVSEPVPVEVFQDFKPQQPILPAPVKVQTPDIAAIAKFLPVKAKVTEFAVPLKPTVVKTKVAAPAKVFKVKAAKAKVAAKAVPVAKMVKAAAAKVVLGKAKMAAPVVKAAVAKTAALKAGKIALAKAKAAKVATVKAPLVISALTKKKLALSLIKLMKAQKLKHLHGAAFAAPVYMY